MSFKILILDSDEVVRELLKRNFIDNFGAEVLEANSSYNAISLLEEQNDISIIVSKNSVDDDLMASNLLNFLYDGENKIPLLIIGEFEHTYKKYALVSGKLRVEEINRLMLKALNLKKSDFEYLKLPDYISYPISYFYLMNSSPADIYIQLNKKDGIEYVKRFNENESFTRDDLKKYESLGLKEFFIFKEDNPNFLNALLRQTLAELKTAEPDRALEVLNSTFAISTDMMRKVGITNEAKQIADQTIAHIAAQVSSGDKLSQLLKSLLSNELSFSYRRSYLISLLSVSILPKLDWVSGEQQSVLLLKLTMVSFYHDLYLDDEMFLKVTNNDELKEIAGELSGNQRDLILNHANKAALLLQSYPKLPSGIDLIVKQHHGVSNGVGFPESYSAAISPLAIVFIVVEEFANQILISEGVPNLLDIIASMQMKFTLPSYRKVVDILADLNKKSKKDQK